MGPAALWLTLLLGPGAESWRPPELEVRAPPPGDFTEIERRALGYLGRPYVMGGVGSPSFDCSGFVCRVFAESGYALPRVSRDQARAGQAVPLDAIRPGDLLFFASQGRPVSHVGLYLGEGQMVHASSGRGEVVVANLSAGWFQRHLVSARRVLTSTVTGGAVEAPPVVVTELQEHGGQFSLPPTLTRPPRQPLPSFGPELPGAGATAIGVRSAFVTEAGVLGAVVVPEASLYVRDWALEAAIGVPIRFETEDATLGTFDRWQDYLRFLRHVSVGLRGADLELRLSQLGEASLGVGQIVDRLAPGTQIQGVPGLTAARAPLSFLGRAKTEIVEVEALLDDALDPGVAGLAAAVPLFGRLRLGGTYATDQRGRLGAARRALNAVGGFARFTVFEDRTFSVDASGSMAALSAFGDGGVGGQATLQGQWRPAGDTTVSARLAIGGAGPHFLQGLFGPTYLAHRARHSAGLQAIGDGRGTGLGSVDVRYGRLGVGAAFGQGFGAGRHPLDRQLSGYVALEALSLGGARRLDVRAVVLSRGVLDETWEVVTVHGSARLALASWLFADLYVQKGETWEGGGGLTVSWAP